MSLEIARAAVDLGMKNTDTSALLFYGGEPLLEKQLMYDIIDYTNEIKKKKNHAFHFKMTTNGTLLDEEFLKFAQKSRISIGFSCDGPAQDDCRKSQDKTGSAKIVFDKIPLLLKYHPYSIGMSVIDPSTVSKASEIVNFLFQKGFRYLHTGVNYSTDAPWTKEKILVLEEEYRKIAKLYLDWTRAEKKFYLSAFDMKILSHLKGDAYNIDRGRMGYNQPSVAPNGKIYSGSKHIGNPVFEIGDAFSGIDEKKHKAIFEKGAEPAELCKKCAIKSRCNYAYDNLGDSGDKNDVSPVQCLHERILTPIVDEVAGILFKEKNSMFLHKHYNDLYPVLSLIEDIY